MSDESALGGFLYKVEVPEATTLTSEHLLPHLESDANASVSTPSAIYRLKDCLVVWFDQYPEPERQALRARILGRLFLNLQTKPSSSNCWIISHIGFLQQDIVHEIWKIAERNDDDPRDIALAIIISLGVPSSEKERFLTALHERIPKHMALSLITALRRLADPSSLLCVRNSWVQNAREQTNVLHRSLALHILVDITDVLDSEGIQNWVSQTIVDLFQLQGQRLALDIYLGGDIAPRCNSANVIPTLL